MSATPDRIEKKIQVPVPRARLWRAITDVEEFSKWFGVKLDAGFVAGAPARGRIAHPGLEHLTFEAHVETIEPERRLTWRWHPHPVKPGVDYASEPMTLVTFELEDAAGGATLSIVESGFDQIPAARRAEAYQGNEQGWSGQVGAIERYFSKAA